MERLHTNSDLPRVTWDRDVSLEPECYSNDEELRGNTETVTAAKHPAHQHDNVGLLPTETRVAENTLRRRTPIHFHELTQWCSDNWVFEILALVISTVCLLGIVTTLLLHGNRPLPQWPFSISINALISALSTVSRSTLAVAVSAAISQRQWIRLDEDSHPLADLEIHDSASRGPWGSMSLLFSFRWSDAASLGALITVLSLAMGPFTQQITAFENAPTPFGISNISSRVVFETGVNSTNGQVFPQGWVQAPETFNPHIYQGLYFDGDLTDTILRNTLQLQPRSSGGNASFGVSESLAVCSQCANITSYLSPAKRSTNPDDWCHSSEGGCWWWTLPNGADINGPTSFANRNTSVLTLHVSFDPIVLDTSDRLTILNVTAIMPGWRVTSFDDTQRPLTGVGVQGQAQECSLYWCVNTYESSLSGGIFNEKIVSSYAAGTMEEKPPGQIFSMKPPGSNSSIFLHNSHEYGNFSTGWVNSTFLVNFDAYLLIHRLKKTHGYPFGFKPI
ncbi:hypothetical protein CTA2_5795 [Colletotrichum tanaceti]|nr:hypothetical protein CTA2_5795 [Colletotrichum tanaceti]